MRRAAGLLGVLVLLVSGCGDQPGYDAESVEQYLSSSQAWRFAGAAEVEGADCPDERDLSEGMTVRCTLTAGGSEVPFRVTLTDVHGDRVNVKAVPDGVIIATKRLREVVELTLDRDSKKAKVDCGDGAFVVAKVGQTLDCQLELGSQTKEFKVTVKSKTGAVEIST